MSKDKRSFFERLTGTVRMDEEERDLSPTKKSSPSRSASQEVESWLEKETNEEGELTVDVYQTPEMIVIKSMIAGVRPEDLDVSITRDMVTIRGKREEERVAKEEDYFARELYWGSFSRTIQLPEEKGQHQEIKTLAQNIISSQSSEIEQMKNWYKTWYGRDLPTGNQVMNVHGMMSNNSGMHMGKMGDDSDLDQLKNTADFDKKFIEEMIPHHQMAVMMASMLKQGTTRPEMKQLADDIVTAQTSEIDQMRQWYQNWSN
jgi:uncharacterized protein (DUF305 family)